MLNPFFNLKNTNCFNRNSFLQKSAQPADFVRYSNSLNMNMNNEFFLRMVFLLFCGLKNIFNLNAINMKFNPRIRMHFTSHVFVLMGFLFGFLVTQNCLAGATLKESVTEPTPLSAQESARELQGIGITEKLGAKIDPNLEVINEQGQLVKIGNYFDGKTPVIFSLVYYSCPKLCSLHLNSVTEALKGLDWTAGKEYRVVALSFDPKDTSDVARLKKENYLKFYGRSTPESGWSFLTAPQSTINNITEQVGFKFKWVPETEEWAHASAAIFLTPDGVVSRYLHGMAIDSQSFKMGINEAAQGKIGTIVDKMIWFCFKYDPHQSKYTLYAFRLVQIGSLIVVILMALFLVPFWLRAKKESNVSV